MEINALLRATGRVITPTLISAAALLANAGPAAATTPTHMQPAQVGAAAYVTASGVAPGCKPGYVWRNARDGDGVCVTPEERQYVYLENINRDSYIPGTVNSCRPGYVWRDAWDGDGVCVVPHDRDLAHQQNAQSSLHSMPATTNAPANAPGCKPGYVWRDARDGDGVCVTPEERQYAHLENINRDSYIPGTVNSCRPGYVWRDAWNGDGVCVVPSDRARAHQQNAESPLHSIG